MRVLYDRPQCLGKGVDIGDGHDNPRLSGNRVPRTDLIGNNDGQAARHGFQNNHAEPLLDRRQAKDIGATIGLDQCMVRNRAGENDMLQRQSVK